MSNVQLTIDEFNLRVFDESYVRIYKCLSMLDDQQIWNAPNQHVPAIGCQILHLCGNVRQWVLSGIGGAADNRERDQEFIQHQNIRKSDFIFLMENMKSQVKKCLGELSEEELTKERTIQGFHVTGFSALIHVLEHFSYHTGQITLLTKLYTNASTGYYDGLNLNKTGG